MRAPWDRPGESAATRRLRIIMFIILVIGILAVPTVIVIVVLFSFRSVLFADASTSVTLTAEAARYITTSIGIV